MVPGDINDAGTIVGYDTVAGIDQGFIDQGGTITQLTGPAGATATYANGLNDMGQVAGDYVGADDNTHGFVYDMASGTYATVDDPNGAGFTLISSINDQGQIGGQYDTGGYFYGFLGTPQGVFGSVTDPLAGATLAAGYGSAGLAAGGGNAVTLLDPGYGHLTLFGNSGNDTFQVAAHSDAVGDTWVGGSGNDTFFDSSAGYATAQPTAAMFLGAGHNTVVSDGEAEVVAGRGTDVLYDPNLAYGGVAGSSMTVVSRVSAPVVVGGAGSLTVSFGTQGAVAFGGTGQGVFVGSGDTFVVGTGPSVVYAGDQTAVFLEGAANAQVDVAAPSGADVAILGDGSAGSDLFTLNAGNTYLTLGGGADTVFLGSGFADAFAGGGADTYRLTAGQAGGQIELNGFRAGTDVVQLAGYGAGEAQTALAGAGVYDGSTYLSLSDGTQLDFVGISNLSPHAFG